MTELMTNEKGEVIYDRSHEHLGTTDAMCIVVRRLLVNAARALRDKGQLPPNVDDVKRRTVDLDHPALRWKSALDGEDASLRGEPLRTGRTRHPLPHLCPSVSICGFPL